MTRTTTLLTSLALLSVTCAAAQTVDMVNDVQPITAVTQPVIRRVAPSVGMLVNTYIDVRGQTTQSGYCTATLVAPGIAVTATHCLYAPQEQGGATRYELGSVKLYMNFTTSLQTAEVFDVDLTMFGTAFENDMDIAVLRVKDPEHRLNKYGHVRLSGQPAAPNEPLFMVHHAFGRPMQVSTRHCTLRALPADALVPIPFKGNIAPTPRIQGHGCAGGGGSSGALVFSLRDGTLRGLHFAGTGNVPVPLSSAGTAQGDAVRFNVMLRPDSVTRIVTDWVGILTSTRGGHPYNAGLPEATRLDVARLMAPYLSDCSAGTVTNRGQQGVDPIVARAMMNAGTLLRPLTQAAQCGVISGYEDGSYRPHTFVTRYQFAVLMARLLDLHHVKTAPCRNPWTDVPAGHWSRDALNTLTCTGALARLDSLTTQYPGEYFGTMNVTVAEVARTLDTLGSLGLLGPS